MSLISTIFSPLAALDRRDIVGAGALPPPALATPAMLYDLLEAYYLNNALYEQIQDIAAERGDAMPALKGLRNPVFRCVEFYTSKLWPGVLPDALPIKTKNPNIARPIEQVWRWSNWSNKKQLAARFIAEYGDLFIKVVQRGKVAGAGESVAAETNDAPPTAPRVPVERQTAQVDVADRRVFFEVLQPQYVTELEEDERDFVTHIRLDVPIANPNARQSVTADYPFDQDPLVPWTHTEVWNKALGTCRIWKHNQGAGKPTVRLGPPDTEIAFEALGIGFVPIVHAKFRDIGKARGVAACTLALDKVDEINGQVTRLHQMMFRYGKPLWAVQSNMVDATRRPLPAPRFDDSPGSAGYGPSTNGVGGSETWINGEPVLYIPGLAELKSLVPNLPYEAFLNAIDAQMQELEGDLPELTFFRVLRQFNDPSGRSLQYILSPAIDRTLEVRGNAETALVRANQIALTLGKAAGIWGNEIGDYNATNETGNFEHVFGTRPVIPMSDSDIAETDRTRSEALERKHNLGVPKRRLWKEMGYDDDEIAENERWQTQEDQDALDKQRKQMELASSLAQPAPNDQQPAGTAGRGAGRPQTNAPTAQPGLTGSRSAPGAQQRGSPNISAANR